MKVPVSLLIPIKNEASNLPRCLASVAWADEVWVVDSASADGSQAIAESHGAKVVQFHLVGTWPKKKNWALENVPWKHEWVFILDADEVLPPEAEEEIRTIVTGNSPDVNGYWINRRFMFLGRWLRHSYYPNWNLRLFRHEYGRYEKLTDADTMSGDNEVHEHVVMKAGVTGRLKAEMDHYAFPTVDVFVEKHNRYANWEARVACERNEKSSAALQHGTVSWRRRLKLLSQRLWGRPLLRFLYVYVWQRGFLDGAEGYHFARLHGFYEYLCVVKTFEWRNRVNRALDR